ncbi:hypothetical protein V8E36_006000 [Tilletia maclaganii]
MNRSSRGHKSTKIPNHRPRPAPAPGGSSSSTYQRDAARRQTEQQDYDHYMKIRRAAGAGGQGSSSSVVPNSYADETFDSMGGRSYRAGLGAAAYEGGEEEDDEDEDETGETAFGKPQVLPLAGVIVCFSSITEHEDRIAYTRSATQLGARVESDLREDVHYLICEKVGSPKYHHALERGKIIVAPSWLEEVQRRYRNDLPFEWEQMLVAHRLRPLTGFHIVCTGYKKDKALAMAKAEELGARVSAEISTENGITHVISDTDRASDSKLVETLAKLRHSYQKGGVKNERMAEVIQNLHIVWAEWLEDCDRACGAIQEKKYSLWRPRPTINQRTEIVQAIRGHYDTGGANHPSVSFHHRLQHLHSQRGGSQLVNGGSRGPKSGGAQGPIGRRLPPGGLSSVLEQGMADQRADDLRRAASGGLRAGNASTKQQSASIVSQSRVGRFSEPAGSQHASILSSQNGKRRVTEMDAGVGTSAGVGRRDSPQPPTKIARTDGTDRKPNPFAKGEDRPAVAPESTDKSANDVAPIFRGLKFRVKFPTIEQTRLMRQRLREAKATVLEDSDVNTQADYTVVPVFSMHQARPREGAIVTRLFIDRCLYMDHLLDPATVSHSQPSPFAAPLPGAEDLVVYLTGFQHKKDIKQLQAEHVIAEAGGQAVDKLDRKVCTHLVCSDKVMAGKVQSDKIAVARKAGIHIVGLDFIDRMLDEGVVDPPSRARRTSRSTSFDQSILGSTQTESVSRFDDQDDHDTTGRSDELLEPPQPLGGVYFAWTSDAKPDAELQRKACELGARVVPLGSDATHLLHEGALTHECMPSNTSSKVHIVHPFWLQACVLTKNVAVPGMFPPDLCRSTPLAAATQITAPARAVAMDHISQKHGKDRAAHDDPAGAELCSSPVLPLKASSTAGSELDDQAFELPNTCGETARVMAALQVEVLPVHAAARAAPPAGRRKLRPQRALGRTGSNGSATELSAADASKTDDGDAPAEAAQPYDLGWPSGMTQANMAAETPPVAVHISYEDDGKKERARLLAALEQDRKRRERGEVMDDDRGYGGDGDRGGRSSSGGGGPSHRNGGGKNSPSGGSKHRILARKQPGARH